MMTKIKNEILKENLMLQKNIPKLYKPSSFWMDATQKIINEIDRSGIENFRRLKTPLSFFVPTYGVPGNGFNKGIKEKLFKIIKTVGAKKHELHLKKWLSGASLAESDYRVFSSCSSDDYHFNMKNFSECNYGNPIEQFTYNNKNYSRSSLNYLLGLCFLNKHITRQDKIETIMEIGGGFGTLGEILSFSKNKKYIDLDIYPNSYISWNYLKNIYKNDIYDSLNLKEDQSISNLPRCTVLNSWNIESLKGKIDLFVNFISFQEMEPQIVENYLKHVIKFNPKWILLRNMKEGKQKLTVKNKIGVTKPIKSEDYIELLKKNYLLVEKNTLEFGYITIDNYNSELLLFKIKK